MKSYAIKLLDNKKVLYLIQKFEKSSINIYMSEYKFKIYDNVIIHYPGDDLNELYINMFKIIKEYIEEFYEDRFIKSIIRRNYCYLNYLEREYIYEITKRILELPDSKIGNINRLLKQKIIDYIKKNKNIYLDGFIEFRLKEYKDILEELIEVSVCSYLDLTSF